MARITPQEALQRASSAQQQGMRLVAAKTSTKKAVKQPEFVMDIDKNGLRSKFDGEGSRLYLFRDGKGGLVLPAYDDINPVLGEFEEGKLSNDLPAHVQAWLAGYAEEIEWMENGHRLILLEDDEEEDKPMADEPKKDVPYLVKTKWGQSAPFNNKLVFDGKIMLVGCPAVMVGQLMHYWGTKGYRRGCTATPKYQYKGGPVIPATPALMKFDYANLPLTKSCTAVQKEAVSTMLQKIGYALLTEYSENSSGAYTTDTTKYMPTRLRLGSTIKYISCDKIGLQAFVNAVYNELANGRPCGFRAKHTANGTITGSHAFVCDGYRAKDDKFHFNFGWTGSYDGWYAMAAMDLTKSDNYTADKGAWIGIQPEYKLGDANRDGKVNITDVMTTIDHSLKGTFEEAADINSDGKVTVADHTPIVNHILGKEPL